MNAVARPQAKPLSDRHLKELRFLVERGRARLTPELPALEALERSFDAVRTGDAGREELSYLAFVWADEVIAAAQWRWASVSSDGTLNPAIVSPDKRHACVPVDCVLSLLQGDAPRPLTQLYEQIRSGQLPESTPGALLLVG